MAEIKVRKDGPVGTIVFSNPDKFNALTADMWRALPERVAELDADPAIRVIVLSGDGDRAFVSGADISQFGQQRTDPEALASYNAAIDAAYLAPVKARKPTIAKIRGVCMGGGLGLAAGCDLRICADDSRFRMPAARLSLGYNQAGVHRFAALIGVQNTYDIFFTARIFDAQEALRMGFVSRVTPADALDATVAELTEAIAENAPLTASSVKLTMNAYLDQMAQVDAPEVLAAIAACNLSDDYKEGVRAFAEKRKPRFTGR